jgi:hypothetical protein
MSTFNTPLWNGSTSLAELGVASANDIIHFAFRALGVLHKAGMGASSDSNSEALTWLNWLVDALNTERLMMHAVERGTYDLASGQTTYLYGDLEASGKRPTRIEAASLIASGSTTETPLPLITLGEMQRQQSGLYVDGQFPHANLTIYPSPNSGDVLVLYAWQALTGFADDSTQYGFAPGYVQMLGWNLADQIAPHFIGMVKIPQPLLDRIAQNARQSKARIKSMNFQPKVLRVDPALTSRGGFDILSGDYR